jgi:hypothetical protein
MTKRMEQSRKRGHYDPRYARLVPPVAVALVPDPAEPAVDEQLATVKNLATAAVSHGKGLVASGR